MKRIYIFLIIMIVISGMIAYGIFTSFFEKKTLTHPKIRLIVRFVDSKDVLCEIGVKEATGDNRGKNDLKITIKKENGEILLEPTVLSFFQNVSYKNVSWRDRWERDLLSFGDVFWIYDRIYEGNVVFAITNIDGNVITSVKLEHGAKSP